MEKLHNKSGTAQPKKRKATPRALVQVYEGDKFLLDATDHMSCCDCGLSHKFKYEIIKYNAGYRVVVQTFRDDTQTKFNRKRKKYPCKTR